MGYGSHANASKLMHGNKVLRSPIYPPKAHGAGLFPDEHFVAIDFTDETFVAIALHGQTW